MRTRPREESSRQSQVPDTLTVGAHCPADATLVMCSGPRGAKKLTGACGVCNRLVYALANLISQNGSFTAPDPADLEPPETEKPDAEHERSIQEGAGRTKNG